MENIIAGAIIAVFVLFFLSIFAPASSTNAFWRFVLRARAIMDAVTYWFMTGCLALMGVAGVVCAVREIWHGRGTLGTLTALAVLATVCALGARSVYLEKRRGVRCECTGDCSRCRIQCMSNEKYYGLRGGAKSPPQDGENGENQRVRRCARKAVNHQDL